MSAKDSQTSWKNPSHLWHQVEPTSGIKRSQEHRDKGAKSENDVDVGIPGVQNCKERLNIFTTMQFKRVVFIAMHRTLIRRRNNLH